MTTQTQKLKTAPAAHKHPSAKPLQDRIFAEKESDAWFLRNRALLQRCDPAADVPMRMMELYQLTPRRVLEIGASNGYGLAAIHERYGARVVAVEPSTSSIRDGRARFPNVRFVRGQADSIPLQETFDLTIVSFVFHWIDRANFLQSMAEIDRLVEESGFLLIADFYPSGPVKVPYHHVPDQGLYTYKLNYAEAFVASAQYELVGLLSGDHRSKRLAADVDEDHRFAVWLLRKAGQARYRERSISNV